MGGFWRMAPIALGWVASTMACGSSTSKEDPGSGVDGGAPSLEGGSSADGAAAMSPDDFATQLAKLNCQFTARCGFLAPSEEKTCEAAVDAAKGMSLPYSEGAASADGRLRFDPKAASDCLAQTKSKGCSAEQQVDVGLVCDRVFAPAVALGGACQARQECIDGYCDRAKFARDGCAGTCAAFTAREATCDPAANHCALTDYCDTATKRCKARSGAGTPCGTDGPFCGAELFCVEGICRGRGVAGNACVYGLFGSSCLPGLFCDTNKCGARHGSGAACASSDACNDGLDCIGLVTDDTGAVTKNGKCGPLLDVGSTCNASGGASGCPGGTACDATSSTCVRFGYEGAACGANAAYDCREGEYCDGKACHASLAIGAACVPPKTGEANPCYAGTRCDATSKRCTLICQ